MLPARICCNCSSRIPAGLCNKVCQSTRWSMFTLSEMSPKEVPLPLVERLYEQHRSGEAMNTVLLQFFLGLKQNHMHFDMLHLARQFFPKDVRCYFRFNDWFKDLEWLVETSTPDLGENCLIDRDLSVEVVGLPQPMPFERVCFILSKFEESKRKRNREN